MSITWKKYHPLSDQNAFICLVDHMGDDSSIVQAARVSYGKDEQGPFDGLNNDNDRKLIRYLMNHAHCYTGDMQVLTTNGWKYWNECIKKIIRAQKTTIVNDDYHSIVSKPESMTDREWKEFLVKLS
jgi:hypothetical protein